METKQFEFSNRLFILAVIIIVALSGAYISKAVLDFQSIPGNYPREITVSGEGKVFIKPDIALISLGVVTEGSDVPTIVGQNNAKMNTIIQDIKDLNIDAKDIQTTQYSLTPRYEYDENGRRFFRGYTMSQQIEVKVRDFAKIGSILDKTTNDGATLVGDLQFSIDNPAAVQQEARGKAIEEARTKAESMARQAGFRLGKLVSISEGYYPYYGYGESLAKGGATPDAAPAPTIEPGQQEVDMTIYLTYRIR
ncbi:MAG: SIMPL domain-containing protein [Candidatus Staskawiczbacteria bacterium]|jgi:hypothetical protein